MEPRLDLFSLGVRDVDVARRFYVDGLGWPVVFEAPGEVVFLQCGHGMLLSLWNLEQLIVEAGPVGTGPAAITLAQVLPSESDVTQLLAQAVAAGGTLLTPGTRREWGGFSGYFADPDGYRWEIAWNPGFRVDADGRVSMAAVDS